jgi:hypothetical protein
MRFFISFRMTRLMMFVIPSEYEKSTQYEHITNIYELFRLRPPEGY